jgi:hypothetical protein
VADTAAKGATCGRQPRGERRFVALVGNGTPGLFGARLGGLGAGETRLAQAALPALRRGMLRLADR